MLEPLKFSLLLVHINWHGRPKEKSDRRLLESSVTTVWERRSRSRKEEREGKTECKWKKKMN